MAITLSFSTSTSRPLVQASSYERSLSVASSISGALAFVKLASAFFVFTAPAVAGWVPHHCDSLPPITLISRLELKASISFPLQRSVASASVALQKLPIFKGLIANRLVLN